MKWITKGLLDQMKEWVVRSYERIEDIRVDPNITEVDRWKKMEEERIKLREFQKMMKEYEKLYRERSDTDDERV